MTTGSSPAPFRVRIDFGGKQGLILLDQIRALDRHQLVKKLGSVEAETLELALERLGAIFAP